MALVDKREAADAPCAERRSNKEAYWASRTEKSVESNRHQLRRLQIFEFVGSISRSSLEKTAVQIDPSLMANQQSSPDADQAKRRFDFPSSEPVAAHSTAILRRGALVIAPRRCGQINSPSG